MSPGLPGLIKLDFEVGGIPVRLGTDLNSDEWIRACETGAFDHVSFLGKLLLGAGLVAGKTYAVKNQDLQFFGGKAASSFTRKCTHALVNMLGDPSQRAEGGAPVWTGKGDRVTLRCTADAYLVHELTAG
jgi:hypothetical protein